MAVADEAVPALPACPDPAFPFDEALGCYEACTTCGQLAWAHAGADPIADMLNTARETSTEAFLEPGFRPSPPVVRPG